MRGVRSGDKGRGKDGKPLGNFEPGTDITAQATVLAEGSWGHLTGAAIREFDLAADREPQVWALGVKEVWKVPKPLDRVIHTLGWPLRYGAKYKEFGGSWIYPMGDDRVSIGFVVDLDYTDATVSGHDLLQQFKTSKLVRRILEGGERVAWGAKAIPEGGYWAMPKLSRAGHGHRRRRRRHGQRAGRSRASTTPSTPGILAAEADLRAAQGAARRTSSGYEQAVEDSLIGKELYESRNMKQPFGKGFFVGGAITNAMVISKGRFPGGRWSNHRDAESPVQIGDKQRRLSQARRQVHLRQALERLHHGQRDARRRAQPHPRARERAARGGRDVGVDVPGRGLRDPRGRAGRGQRRRDRQLHQLRAVRGDHGQGRAPDDARGRRRPALPGHLSAVT